VIWSSKHAAIGAGVCLLCIVALERAGESGLAMLCWIPAALLTIFYMTGPADEVDHVDED